MPFKTWEVFSKVAARLAEDPDGLLKQIAIRFLATRVCREPKRAFEEAKRVLDLEASQDTGLDVVRFHDLDSETPFLEFRLRAGGYTVRLRGKLDPEGDVHIVQPADVSSVEAADDIHTHLSSKPS